MKVKSVRVVDWSGEGQMMVRWLGKVQVMVISQKCSETCLNSHLNVHKE